MAVPVKAAIVLATFILATTAIGMIALLMKRRREAQEDELRRTASVRGWTFQSTLENRYRVHRWTGSTDGIPWVAESLNQTSGKKNHERHRHIARWRGQYSPGINGAIVAMGVPKGKEQLGHQGIPAGDGLLAKLAQKAVGFAFDKAIDAYFGKDAGTQVDAGAMHRVETKIPGFIIMAADKDEGARIVQQGLERSIVDATTDKGSALSNENRPWVLLQPHAITLARMEQLRDVTELESFIRTGVALTRAFTFGRRSLS